MEFVIVAVIAALAGALLGRRMRKKKEANGPVDVPPKWKAFLAERVHFYQNLEPEQRVQFEQDVARFLKTIHITGVEVVVTYEDRLLVAASAVIPLFGFPEFSYQYLDEVILYPGPFDRNFNYDNPSEIITGMVGNGPMEGKMILSKPSLHAGFDINNDKKNVGIHEFVHLFDKEDGRIDGVPPGYEDKSYSLPWLGLVQEKIQEIVTNTATDINDYGATNHQEFFAVASEYFFERPHLLKRKHPKLYGVLTEVFNQDPTTVIDPQSFGKADPPGRNDPCPCGSGLKYKRCCME
ncbi:MAG TPA: peptidase [Cytophagales bacterium]|nr:peptidase [Cytophagales bacterium]HAA23269.1 peptidase [Cytophagales bacterium]HAP61839.1 peptidase [Cytophagales bacterium]